MGMKECKIFSQLLIQQRAAQQLQLASAACVPNTIESARKRFFRELQRMSNPPSETAVQSGWDLLRKGKKKK